MLGDLFFLLMVFVAGAEVGVRFGGAKKLWTKAKGAFKA